MRMRVSVVFFVLILLSFATSVQAQSEYGKGDPRVYVGLSGLIAFDDAFGALSDANGGATLRTGVRLGAPIAFELQGDVVRLRTWRDDSLWTLTANFRVYPTQLEALAGLLPDSLQPYTVTGIGVMGGDPKGDRYQVTGAFRLGMGADVYLTEQLALSVGYEWLTGTGFWTAKDSHNLLVGLQYNY
ncbi:MAG: outer membrane beta-barrel protein [Gemmatimonadota bacterium]|nr:outer membrane beta-barrel protein [Gemmatimonadota bacterium]MEE2672279.1 outer membrane beta-barrel protein [Myxococcota bacterium]